MATAGRDALAFYIRRVRTLTRRMQSDLDVMKAVIERMENLAQAGTHADLPGNGQDKEN